MTALHYLISGILACAPCIAYQPTPIPPLHITDQKIYRTVFELGSGNFKMVVAEMDKQNQVQAILGEKSIAVPLGADFKKHGTITEETEQRILNIFQELVSFAKELTSQAGENSLLRAQGVATAMFRKAGERGEIVLSHLSALVGKDFRIKIISAVTEGKAGLFTAEIVSKEKNPDQPAPKLALDCGNGSFQLSYKSQGEVKVFAGNIGVADVNALYMKEIVRMPVCDLEQLYYMSISQEQVDRLVSLINVQYGEVDEELQELMRQEKGHLVTIGDVTSIFSCIEAIIGRNTFTKAEVKQILDNLTDRDNATEFQAKYPVKIRTIIPRTAFLYALMDKLGIESIENYVTVGTTKGLLIAPELW